MEMEGSVERECLFGTLCTDRNSRCATLYTDTDTQKNERRPVDEIQTDMDMNMRTRNVTHSLTNKSPPIPSHLTSIPPKSKPSPLTPPSPPPPTQSTPPQPHSHPSQSQSSPSPRPPCQSPLSLGRPRACSFRSRGRILRGSRRRRCLRYLRRRSWRSWGLDFCFCFWGCCSRLR